MSAEHYIGRAAESAARAKANRIHKGETDWKAIALEALDALQTFNAFYDDLAKSNPGFMGKLCLQNYAQFNEALLKSERLLPKWKSLNKTKTRE